MGIIPSILVYRRVALLMRPPQHDQRHAQGSLHNDALLRQPHAWAEVHDPMASFDPGPGPRKMIGKLVKNKQTN